MNRSKLSKYVNNVFEDKHSVVGVLENDYDALRSRIRYVQNHEDSSLYGLNHVQFLENS